MINLSINKKNIAIFLALLFHFCGACGILYTAKKDWFISNTPLNLALMAALLIWVQPRKNLNFFLFIIISFLVGMGVEMVGVNTGKLFGSYCYGTVMGAKLNGVPYLIGINWFVIIFCVGVFMSTITSWIEDKYDELGIHIKPWIKQVSFLFDGALLATIIDLNIEPGATKLLFWQWKDGTPPTYNFFCWFVISVPLLWVFNKLNFAKDNQFATHLLIIQSLFFITLNIYLK